MWEGQGEFVLFSIQVQNSAKSWDIWQGITRLLKSAKTRNLFHIDCTVSFHLLVGCSGAGLLFLMHIRSVRFSKWLDLCSRLRDEKRKIMERKNRNLHCDINRDFLYNAFHFVFIHAKLILSQMNSR